MSDLTNTFGGQGYDFALIDAAYRGNVDIVRLLIQARTDIRMDLDATDSLDETALMHAARNGYTEIVRLLLEAGADANEPYMTETTALMYAAGGGHTEIVRLLLDAGADVNAETDEGDMALTYAVRIGHTEIVRLLIEAGADVDIVDIYEGETALMYAAQVGHTEIVRLLIEAGAYVNNSIRSLLASQAMNTVIPRHRARQRDRMALGELELYWDRVPDGRLPSIPLEEGPPLRRRRLSSRKPGFNDLVYANIQDFL